MLNFAVMAFFKAVLLLYISSVKLTQCAFDVLEVSSEIDLNMFKMDFMDLPEFESSVKKCPIFAVKKLHIFFCIDEYVNQHWVFFQ